MTRVADVMTTGVITVSPAAPFRELARLMVHHGVGALLVVDPQSDHLMGIATEADLIGKLALGARAAGDLALIWEDSAVGAGWVRRALGLTARELMTTEVVFTVPEASMEEAASLMVGGSLKHLPVVSGGRVVGMLARRDLLRTFDRSDTQVRRDVIDALEDRQPTGTSQGPEVAEVEEGVVTLKPTDGPRRRSALAHRIAALPGVVAVRT